MAPKRGKKRISGRFYVFLAIFVVLVVAIVLIVWRPWAKADDVTTQGNVQQPVDSVQDENTEPPVDAVSNAALNDDGTVDESFSSALAERLATEDEIEGLQENEMIQVSDLSINTNLSDEWLNVLLLGTDERDPSASARSDTMIICSINTTTGEVKLTSLMRDIAIDYVDMGIYSGTHRINAASYFGGPELTMKIVNEHLDLNISSYVVVNFYGFQQMAELLGGIDIEITEAEMNEINRNAYSQYQMAIKNGIDESNLEHTNVLLEEYGHVHLNGRQTLAYARIRKIDSDWSRSQRQLLVLQKLVEQLRGKNATELLALAIAMEPYFETNLDLQEILSIAVTVLDSDLSDIKEHRIPVDKSYAQETRDNQSMLYDVDWATNTLQLHNFIYYTD